MKKSFAFYTQPTHQDPVRWFISPLQKSAVAATVMFGWVLQQRWVAAVAAERAKTGSVCRPMHGWRTTSLRVMRGSLVDKPINSTYIGCT
jgi:hypothetical protein